MKVLQNLVLNFYTLRYDNQRPEYVTCGVSFKQADFITLSD